MRKLPKWLGWTLKVIGWMCLLPVCLVVLAVLIGWVGDLTASAKWEAGRKKALERIEKAKTAEYESGFTFAVINTNAWDYYLKASATLDSLKIIELDSLVFSPVLNYREANIFLSKYQKEVILWDSGASSRYCRTAVEYEKGLEAPIPDYLAYQKLLKLGLLRGRVELSTGKAKQGADTYCKALKTAMDISGGNETIIGRMVGIGAGRNISRVISCDIDRFDTKAAVILRGAFEKVEKTWPPIYLSIEMDALSTYIFFNEGFGNDFFNGDKVITSPMLGFVHRVGYSLLSWKHFFSLKRDMINYSELQQRIADEAALHKDEPWSGLEPVLNQTQKHIKEATKGDVFASIAMPNFKGFFASEYQLKMGFRVIKNMLILREYLLKNKKYPNDVGEVVNDSFENNDIASGKPLHYDFHNGAVRLYSIGLNLKDDGGQGFSLSENLLRYRESEGKDDICLKQR